MKTSLGHFPASSWQFDASVTDCFDDMLRRSIPEYETMRLAVDSLIECYRGSPGSCILDLGCSRGDALVRTFAKFGEQHMYYGVDSSESMVEAARERFRGQNGKKVFIEQMDLTKAFPDVGIASVTLAILTLQFIPFKHRPLIIRKVFDNLSANGAFIFVEKVEGPYKLRETFVDLYHERKRANGYSPEEIEAKRASLEGVLMPVLASINERMLYDAGFQSIDCFWRWMNFAGWIALK